MHGSGPPPPLHPRNPPPVAPDHPPPGNGPSTPHGPRHNLTTNTPERERQREGPRQGGRGRPKVTGTRPQGQGTGVNTTRRKGTTGGPPILRKGKGRGHGTGEANATTGTRTRTKKAGRATPGGPAPPHPPHSIDTRDPGGTSPHGGIGGPPQRRTPAKTRYRSPDPTLRETHRVARTDHRQ